MRSFLVGVPVLAAVALGSMGLGSAASVKAPAAPLTIPQEIVATVQETKMGGLFLLEVDGAGKVISYAAEIEPSAVPAVCREALEKAHPGGKIVSAEKEIIEGKTYFEISKEIDGLSVEGLATPDGKVVGGERELAKKDYPAEVVAAANKLVTDGEVVAVEKVEGPETLGAPEHHVKKRISGEIVRIRVTDKGAVEALRRVRTEIKAPRK